MNRIRILYNSNCIFNITMRESRAKQSIIKTARKLIEKKGYSNVNVNEVAYVAKVSVGTLYYHFPNGKVDILAEIMSQKTAGFVDEFNRQLGVEKVLEKGMSLEDALRWIFKKVLELRRPDRQFLAAIQSEMFSNPDDYSMFVKKYQSTDGLQQAMSILSEFVVKTGKSETDRLSKVGDKLERIQRVVGLMMNFQIMFPGYFGNDDEFIDLALRIFFEILESKI
ncbi:MAG: TetR/AcrR family transcriptional regulator [Candidatus Hermodarchaeota archaeon]|nr:TetR/AcrR family transcriptional regulator [Candidatus Hermodarchaeota archaeon]